MIHSSPSKSPLKPLQKQVNVVNIQFKTREEPDSGVFLGVGLKKQLTQQKARATNAGHRYGGMVSAKSTSVHLPASSPFKLDSSSVQTTRVSATTASSTMFADQRKSHSSGTGTTGGVKLTSILKTSKQSRNRDEEERLARRRRRKHLAAKVAAHWIMFTRIRGLQRTWRSRLLFRAFKSWKSTSLESRTSRRKAQKQALLKLQNSSIRALRVVGRNATSVPNLHLHRLVGKIMTVWSAKASHIHRGRLVAEQKWVVKARKRTAKIFREWNSATRVA